MPKAEVKGVRALSRGLRVLEILVDSPLGLPLSRIAEQSGLSKSSAHRLLQTLVQNGYLSQKQESGHYFPSLKVLTLSHKLIEDTDLRAVSHPHLEALAKATGETAHLVLLDHDSMIYVDKVESSSPIRMYSRIGRSAPAHCTGVGKVILAHLSADRRADLLGGEALARYTPNTITDRVELEQNLAQIRQRGFAVDDGEHEESVRCLASPLFGADGRIVGAMSIATVSYRVSLPTLLSWWPILREHTAQLRAELVHYFDRYSER